MSGDAAMMVGQESERELRDRLAAAHAISSRPALLDTVAEYHCVPVMRRRAQDFAARFTPNDRVLDVGIGWGWHWHGRTDGPCVIGVDMSVGNLRLARRVLGKTDRVLLVCADAAALPLRDDSLAGVWSIQTFQHMPERVLAQAKSELDRVLREDFSIEMSDLNPGLLLRIVYRLAGRRLHRRGRMGEMELSRRTAREWTRIWSDFRRGRCRLSTGYSELFFHPDLHLRPRRYPLRLERALGWLPMLARMIARQVDVRIAGGTRGEGTAGTVRAS
jgi:ubiquinone/menaquinone biosynthesis C-methylase UbiE